MHPIFYSHPEFEAQIALTSHKGFILLRTAEKSPSYSAEEYRIEVEKEENLLLNETMTVLQEDTEAAAAVGEGTLRIPNRIVIKFKRGISIHSAERKKESGSKRTNLKREDILSPSLGKRSLREKK